MATKLYLRDAASTANPGSDEERQLTLGPGPSVVGYVKNTVAGTVTPPTTATQFTKVAGGTNQIWLSEPLNAITISGTVTFNLWASESAAPANATITAELLRCDNAGNVLSVIVACVLNRAELSITAAANNWTATPTSTALSSQDRLGVRVYVDDGNGVTMGSGRTVTVNIDGPTTGANGDSYVQTNENLSIYVPPERTADGAQSSAASTQSSTSANTIQAASGQSVPAATQSNQNATSPITGVGNQSTPAATQSGAGTQPLTAAGNQSLIAPTHSATGLTNIVVESAQSIPAATQSGSFVITDPERIADGSQSIGEAVQSGSSTTDIQAASSQSVPSATQSGANSTIISANGNQEVFTSIQSSDSITRIIGAGSQTVGAAEQQSISVLLIDANGNQVTPLPQHTGAGEITGEYTRDRAVWLYQSTVSILHTHSSLPVSPVTRVSHLVDLKVKEEHTVSIYHKRESSV